MKRFFQAALAAIFLSALALLGGCATQGTSAGLPNLTFAQQVSIVCSAANTAVSIAIDDQVFTGGAANTLNNDIKPAISAVCGSGAVATTSNLQKLVQNTLPLLKSAVNATSLSQQNKNYVDAAIDLVKGAVNTAIALAPASAAASTSTAAAPAAAPSTLAPTAQ